MNRRDFLGRFGIGVSAALALASLPPAAIDGLSTLEAAKLCASEYLRKIYNEHANGRLDQCPRRMEAGRELFEAYEGELVANIRFCQSIEPPGPPNLMFKGARVDCVGRGWTARVVQ